MTYQTKEDCGKIHEMMVKLGLPIAGVLCVLLGWYGVMLFSTGQDVAEIKGTVRQMSKTVERHFIGVVPKNPTEFPWAIHNPKSLEDFK